MMTDSSASSICGLIADGALGRRPTMSSLSARPWNGSCPVVSQYRLTPIAHMSERSSSSTLPVNCSGDMKGRVPATPLWSIEAIESCGDRPPAPIRASPKSEILMIP